MAADIRGQVVKAIVAVVVRPSQRVLSLALAHTLGDDIRGPPRRVVATRDWELLWKLVGGMLHADRRAKIHIPVQSIEEGGVCSMLGNLIGETRGKRIVRRVLSATPARIEVTFEDAGKMLGVEVNGLGTYTSEIRADGSIYGEGQGLYLTATGEGLAWKGSGLGRFGEGGAISYRGILYYQSTSSKFAKLNTVTGVFEYEIDPKGETQAKVWEWS